MSNYGIMMEQDALISRMEALEKERNLCVTELSKLQKRCPHEVVIHYGEDPLLDIFQQTNFIRHFLMCPHCGSTNMSVKLKDLRLNPKLQEDGPNFILEASGYRGNNMELNLQTVLDYYRTHLEQSPTISLKGLMRFLEIYDINYYNGIVFAR